MSDTQRYQFQEDNFPFLEWVGQDFPALSLPRLIFRTDREQMLFQTNRAAQFLIEELVMTKPTLYYMEQEFFDQIEHDRPLRRKLWESAPSMVKPGTGAIMFRRWGAYLWAFVEGNEKLKGELMCLTLFVQKQVFIGLELATAMPDAYVALRPDAGVITEPEMDPGQSFTFILNALAYMDKYPVTSRTEPVSRGREVTIFNLKS